MSNNTDFDLIDFLPYILNQAAEASSLGFQSYYKSKYGMLRTEWRVLFHLGRYGPMTAKEICDRAMAHKTKVSRAVSALEAKRLLVRARKDEDRRQERLLLTDRGEQVYRDLSAAARAYDSDLMRDYSVQEQAVLRRCLKKIAGL